MTSWSLNLFEGKCNQLIIMLLLFFLVLILFAGVVYVRVWFSSGLKGMSHIISMTQMQQWWLGNFMQNWSYMHLRGHSSIKLLWSCDTRAHNSFSLLYQPSVSKICSFINLSIHPSLFLGVRENFHSVHPSSVYTFFSKTGYDQWIFSKKSWKLSLFTSMLFSS